MTLDLISGPLGPLSFDIWGQGFLKVMLGVKRYKCTKYGPCGYRYSFARGDRRKHLAFISGALGPLSFNRWGPNYSKVLRGPMGYKCTKFVPRGYCSFLLQVRRRSILRRRRRRLSSKRRISKPCFTGIDNNI